MKSIRSSLRWNSNLNGNGSLNQNGSENASVASSSDDGIVRASEFMNAGESGSGFGGGTEIDGSNVVVHRSVEGTKLEEEEEEGSLSTATATTATVVTSAAGSSKQQPQHPFLEIPNPDDRANYHHPETVVNGHDRSSINRHHGMAATSNGILRRSERRTSATKADFSSIDPHNKGAPHIHRTSFQLTDPSLGDRGFDSLPLGSVAVLGPSHPPYSSGSSDYYPSNTAMNNFGRDLDYLPNSLETAASPNGLTHPLAHNTAQSCCHRTIARLFNCCFCRSCRNTPSNTSKQQWKLTNKTPPLPTSDSSTHAPSPISPSRSFYCLGRLLCLPCYLLLLPLTLIRPNKITLDAISSIIHSRLWWFTTILFTFVLLFGSQVQQLWFHKSFDAYFDILFVVTFIFLSFDVLFRSYSQPKYFVVRMPWYDAYRKGLLLRRRPSTATTTATGTQNNTTTAILGTSGPGGILEETDPSANDVTIEVPIAGNGPMGTSTEGTGVIGTNPAKNKESARKDTLLAPLLWVGSFMFWCDFLATLTLLYDIGFVNRTRTQMDVDEIGLNVLGLPIFGMSDIKPVPYEFQVALLIQIGRTARVARFIRAASVVRLSSKVNWYWIPDRLDLSYWYRLFQKVFSKKTKRFRAEAGSEDETNGEGGGDNDDENEKKKKEVKKKTPSANNSFLRRIFSIFGPRVDHETTRHLAATKIQRAWRARAGISPAAGGVSGIIHSWPRKPPRSSQIMRQRRNYHDGSIKRSTRGSRDGSSTINGAKKKSNPESQVGNAMRELTAQRVAAGIIVALVMTTTFTYDENDGTATASMILLHAQTQFSQYRDSSILAARRSSIPNLYQYTDAKGGLTTYTLPSSQRPVSELREREKRLIIVHTIETSSLGDERTNTTEGLISIRDEISYNALVELVTTIFIIAIWVIAVTAFAGPVMTLVVTPINRMRQLLRMLTGDPLGYQFSRAYKNFEAGEDEFIKNTRWTKDILKGMETSFLMSTIHQIGSLMKVGFGSAGVEIIKNNLRGKEKDALFLNTQGMTVSCIFLFCDIRQFTDATECLQEEVFVFTNRIAAVVHSLCHQYGGSANKNVGDAFLVSWLLDDPDNERRRRQNNMLESSFNQNKNPAIGSRLDIGGGEGNTRYSLHAKNHQADKALLSVVKICIALYHDDYFIQEMSEGAKTRLLDKLKKRKGPIVQMGFGLHAGKAVQGAIGSQRKLDATYVAESVEMAEFLESSTKKFGLKMLMSEAFHSLLNSRVSRKCRKIDQICIRDEEAASDEGDYVEESDIMNVYTFDIDLPALFSEPKNTSHRNGLDGSSSHTISAEQLRDPHQDVSSFRRDFGNIMKRYNPNTLPSTNNINNNNETKQRRRVSVMAAAFINKGSNPSTLDITPASIDTSNDNVVNLTLNDSSSNSKIHTTSTNIDENGRIKEAPDLVLPTGQTLYSHTVWLSPDMKKIRQKYSDGIFFQKFNSGLQSFYARDWDHARQCFQTILERFEDGPSRYFMKQIEDNNGIPPPSFKKYGSA